MLRVVLLFSYVLLIGCGSGSGTDTPNSEPVVLSETSFSVLEGQLETGHQLLASDDDGDTLAYRISGGDDSIRFNIDASNGEILLLEPFDYESPVDQNQDNRYDFEVTVDDGKGGESVVQLSATVLDTNEPPVISVNSTPSVTENRMAIDVGISATDVDQDTLVYSLSGTDSGHFIIDAQAGLLTFLTAPDFESPTDANADNIYNIEVTVADPDGLTAQQAISLSITNEIEPPVLLSGSSGFIVENGANTSYLMQARSESGDLLDLTIAGGADRDVFEIIEHQLRFIQTPDYENPADQDADNIYVLDVAVTDPLTQQVTEQSIQIQVENQSQLAIEVYSPSNNAQIGGWLDYLSVRGAISDLEDGRIDAGDIVSFEVNGVEVTLDATASSWMVSIPIVVDVNTIDINVVDRNDQEYSQSLTVSNMGRWGLQEGLFLDTLNNRLLMTTYRGMAAVNLSTKAVTQLPTFTNEQNTQQSFTDVTLNPSTGIGWGLNYKSVQRFDLANASFSTVSNNDTGEGTEFGSTSDMAIDEANNKAYVLDKQNKAIIAVDLTSGSRSVISNDTTGLGEHFYIPTAIEIDLAEGRLFVTDIGDGTLFSVDIDTGDRTVIHNRYSGDYRLEYPEDIVWDAQEKTIYVADEYGRIVKISVETGLAQYLSGTGPSFGSPKQIVLDKENNRLFVLNLDGDAIVTVDINTGVRELLLSNAIGSGPGFLNPWGMVIDSASRTGFVADGSRVWAVDLTTGNRRTITGYDYLSGVTYGEGPTIRSANDITVDQVTNRLFVADIDNRAIYSVDIETGNREVISSSSVGQGAGFGGLYRMDIDRDNNRLLVVDIGLNALLSVDIANGDRTFLSDDSTGSGESFSFPVGVSYNAQENKALVLEDEVNALFEVNLETGDRTIISGAGVGEGSVGIYRPTDLVVNADYSKAYIGAESSSALIEVDLETGARKVIPVEGPKVSRPIAIGLDSHRGLLYSIGYVDETLYLTDLETTQGIIVSK